MGRVDLRLHQSRLDPGGPCALVVNQDPEKLSLEAVLDHRMVSLRNPKILSIFRVPASILTHFAAGGGNGLALCRHRATSRL